MMDYQRVWAEINLDNIGHNASIIKNSINTKTEIIGIVKADGYGHGAVEISKILLHNGVANLGVAICDEGVALRQNNIFVPILILGFTPEPKLSEIVLNDLTQTIFSLDMAKSLSKIAKKLNKNSNIHIKIDTGMSRLGFLPTEKSAKEILEISKLSNINITGMYTHFAVADEKNKEFTFEQFNRFQKILDLLKKLNITIPNLHVSNSAAALDIRQFDLDYIRPGIILYGLSPSKNVEFEKYDFKPAMTLKTRISYLKELEKGVSIGYGRTYFTERKTKVATIPVGYADGYPRIMKNSGRVLIAGEYAPIVGNICMDQMMVDVTDIKIKIKPSDEVVLIGKQKNNEITFDEIANIQQTINYEVICNIGKRVPRVYTKNNTAFKTINYTV